MKIGSSLALICIGAILAFAVTGNTSVFNIHTAGWVLMLVGLVGLLLPRSATGWLGRRLLIRRTYPGGRVQQVPVPPYVHRTPSAIEGGLVPPQPILADLEEGGDLIEETEVDPYSTDPYVPGAYVSEAPYPSRPARSDGGPTDGRTGRYGTGSHGTGRPPSPTEVIDDLYEEP
jgi:hypothetical protein